MSKTVNGIEYLSYQEVAKELGFSDSTISVMVSRGTFDSVKFRRDAKKYISSNQVESYKNNDLVELDTTKVIDSNLSNETKVTPLTNIKADSSQEMSQKQPVQLMLSNEASNALVQSILSGKVDFAIVGRYL